jgi:hypothetical protein
MKSTATNAFHVEYYEGDLTNDSGTITAYMQQSDPFNQSPYREHNIKVADLMAYATKHNWFDWCMEFKEHPHSITQETTGTMTWEDFCNRLSEEICHDLSLFLKDKFKNNGRAN